MDTVARLRLSLLRLARRMRQHADVQITPSQLSALATIARRGPLRLGDLAERERISRPTVTRLVARLERSGYVERRADPADGRIRWIVISDAGRRVLEGSCGQADRYLARRVSALSPEDQALLARCLPVLEQLLEGRP